MRIHLDTDIGGDSDDLCALALLLATPDVELVGVTTVADSRGRRASFVRHALKLVGRESVPVASGAAGFLGGFAHDPEPQGERYWPGIELSGATPGSEALDLLAANAASGATVVAIGPFTNLALLEAMRPGAFASAPVVVMGGFTRPLPDGYPGWGPDMDYNVQSDRVAARVVFERLNPLVVPVEITMETALRSTDLPALRSGGPLARLMALQAEFYALDAGIRELARTNSALPDDLLNFQHDPLACAVALAWDCVEVANVAMAPVEREGQLVLEPAADAPVRRLVARVQARAFEERWLEAVRTL